MEERSPQIPPPQDPVSAVRLIFEYDGDQVKLISQQPLEMVVSSLDVSKAEHAAYYIDSRDAAGKTLARVKAHGAFSSSTEVFPEHHNEPISRIETPQPKGAFTVVVPTPKNTSQVSVMKTPAISPQDIHAAAASFITPTNAKAEAVASFPLLQTDKPAGGNQ